MFQMQSLDRTSSKLHLVTFFNKLKNKTNAENHAKTSQNHKNIQNTSQNRCRNPPGQAWGLKKATGGTKRDPKARQGAPRDAQERKKEACRTIRHHFL